MPASAGMTKYFAGMTRYVAGMTMWLLAACAAPPHAPGGPFYFRSYTSHHAPFEPLDEIGEAEALRSSAYCVAWFTDDGRILRAERWYDGARLFEERYTYSNGRIVERRWTDNDGPEQAEPCCSRKTWR